MTESTVPRRISEFVGVALFAAALIWLIALVTWDPADPVWFFTTESLRAPANFAGRVGAFLSELSFQVLGYAAYLLPPLVGVVGWHYFWCRAVDAAYTKALGVLLLVTSLATFLSLVVGSSVAAGRTFHAGGSFGNFSASVMADYFARPGAVIIVLTLLALAALLSTQVSLGRMFAAATEGSRRVFVAGIDRMQGWLRARRRAVEAAAGQVTAMRPQKAARPSTPVGRADAREDRDDREEPRVTPPPRQSSPVVARRRAEIEPTLPLPEPEPGKNPRRLGAFTLPPLSLLDAPKAEGKIDERELMEGARHLEEKCREFAVEGQVVQIHPGPVVTTFELKPDAGVKYSKITNLADDLCLAMQAESVLIDRIPGKSTVGIQIPNPQREAISLREILESDAYQKSESKLTMVLGKTINGEPYVTNLATMPHLLIAGSTGTGKSVGLNAMLTSLLYRATPDDVRLIMIDPKRLELGMYEDIPHLLTPVVVDPKKAANALRWAVREMEERYKTLAAEGVRNIEQYNRNIRNILADPEMAKNPEAPRPLPFIVVVIDELADLMMVASNEVEESICRLAQMARAVGIHLILATQRPSVDVITGLIKANLPSRISFRVSSKVDSRTILDANGAEQLLGKGDMLFLAPATSRCIRLHGPYNSEQESARLASFLRKQGKPVFDETVTAEEEKAGPG
ncbi:MAG: DNA translocase FtsK, partial [Vicinamibacterales bacterium]|nr:DNA translocase FtsK [Vicinamibacterales bacterium]